MNEEETMTNKYETLQETVAAWLRLKDEKKRVTSEFNDAIRELEERIATISDRIDDDNGQASLPFDDGGDDEPAA